VKKENNLTFFVVMLLTYLLVILYQ